MYYVYIQYIFIYIINLMFQLAAPALQTVKISVISVRHTTDSMDVRA